MYVPFDETDHEAILNNLEENSYFKRNKFSIRREKSKKHVSNVF